MPIPRGAEIKLIRQAANDLLRAAEEVKMMADMTAMALDSIQNGKGPGKTGATIKNRAEVYMQEMTRFLVNWVKLNDVEVTEEVNLKKRVLESKGLSIGRRRRILPKGVRPKRKVVRRKR